jgi:hypothetical protein
MSATAVAAAVLTKPGGQRQGRYCVAGVPGARTIGAQSRGDGVVISASSRLADVSKRSGSR